MMILILAVLAMLPTSSSLHTHSHKQGHKQVSPYNVRQNNQFEVQKLSAINPNISLSFNAKEIVNGQELSKELTAAQPHVSFNRQQGKTYAIVMVDPDAPSASNPTNRYWLHWLMVNNNHTVMEYKGPTPPAGSGTHRYFICIFQQNGKINLEGLSNISRPKFNLEKFWTLNNLKQVGCFKFQVTG